MRKFELDNTEGFTQTQLDEMNEKLFAEVSAIEKDYSEDEQWLLNDVIADIKKRICDEQK